MEDQFQGPIGGAMGGKERQASPPLEWYLCSLGPQRKRGPWSSLKVGKVAVGWRQGCHQMEGSQVALQALSMATMATSSITSCGRP